jgi:hypothetical protein
VRRCENAAGWQKYTALRKNVLSNALFAICFNLCVICLVPAAAQRNPSRQALNPGLDSRNDCQKASQLLLGSRAEVINCGSIHDHALEVVAIVRVRGLRENRNGIPISRLVILVRQSGRWVRELNVNEEITNEAGWVGIDFIDDSHSTPYYRLKTSDNGAKWGDRKPSQFTLVLLTMSRTGKVDPEDLGIGIGWNSAVSRFQEIDPSGTHFIAETKAPKHYRAR